jgi:hypothetical protein
MEPIAIHAHNPGPMTGDGNWTWLLKGRVTTLVDAGTGDARHLDARGRGARRARAGAGAGDARARRPLVRRAGAARPLSGVRFRKMPWPGRDAKWPVDWDPIVPAS